MAKLSAEQVGALAYNAGVKTTGGLTHAIAIASLESGFDTEAVGDVGLQTATWGPSIGLWQIRSLKAESGKGTDRDATRLKDPVFNANSMAHISKNGSDFSAWTTGIAAQLKRPLYTDIALGLVATGGKVSDITGTVKGGVDTVTGAASSTAQAAKDISTAVRAAYNWIANRDNWDRVMKVVAGGALLVGGIYLFTRPIVNNAVEKVGKVL